MIPIFNELEYARMMNNGHSETRSQEDKRKYTYQELLIYTKWLRWSLFISDKNEESKAYSTVFKFINILEKEKFKQN